MQGVVVFFPGDQLEHAYAAPEIRRLQDPKIQAQLMAAKFPGCSSVVCACPLQPQLSDTHTYTVSSLLVCLARVMPSRLEGSYACFDHFLEQVTRSGEPLGYPASQLKVTHVYCCCVQLLIVQGSEPCLCATSDRSEHGATTVCWQNVHNSSCIHSFL